MKYIIAKYADDHYPDGKAPVWASISDTYTAKECGVTGIYERKEQAEIDLKKVVEFNPCVGYGILEVT